MKALVVLLMLSSSALAQSAPPLPSAPPYAPPDRELWEGMARLFADLPVSLAAHQQIQSILASVQREAQRRAALSPPQKPE